MRLQRLISLLSLSILIVLSVSGPVFGGGLPSAVAAQNRPYHYVLHVYFNDTAERDRLATEYGAEEVGTQGGYLTIVADAATYAEIQARGLRVEINHGATARLNDPDTFYGGYKTVEEMQAFLDQKVAQYPGLAEKQDIGDSWCKQQAGGCQLTSPTLSWNGFDLYVLRITNRALPGPKPVFFFDAGIHSREIATPEVAMRFINWLLDGYANNPDARWLVDHHEIYVMPMLNPDGHHMVEYGGDSPLYIRKNADYANGCTTWGDGNGLGTDLNRNFSFLWGCCGGSSASACSQTYRGPSAGNEPETQAVMAKISSLIPDQRGPAIGDAAPLTTTGIYQSMHSYANLNLYAWGMSGYGPSPNGADMANIGAHLAAADAYPPGNSYQSCQGPDCLYGVDGDAVDWGYGVLGIPSVTTELSGGSGGFLPPYEEVDSLFWPENRGMLTYMAKLARAPYLLTRGPDTHSVATNPMTVTAGTPAQLTAVINYAWTGNGYSQNVAAAEYYVDTPPWAGGTAVPLAAADGSYNAPTESVQATVATTGFTPGRHIVFVRGRGVNSYQGFPSWGPVTAVFLDVLGPTDVAVAAVTAAAPAAPDYRPAFALAALALFVLLGAGALVAARRPTV